MTDVLGFIEGKEHLSVGYWKFIVMLKIVSIHLINIINVHMNYVKDLIKEKALSKYADMSNCKEFFTNFYFCL